jgi:hypothetical protein
MAKVKTFSFALFLEVSPLRLNTLFKFLSSPEDVRPDIVMFAVSHHKFEIFFNLPSIVVLPFSKFLDDGGDIYGIFNFLIVIREGITIYGLPEYF